MPSNPLSQRMELKSEVVRVTLRPKNLGELRRQRGLTLRELASRCGLSTGFLNDLEWNRRTCSQEAFDRIKEALA